MTDPIDLEALRGHTPGPWPIPEYENSDVSNSNRFDCGIGYVWNEADARLVSYAPDLLAECERLRAELTARRARDAEVGALVAKWREAASGIEEGCDDDDFLSDIEHDEAIAAAMFSCADDLESALLPFQRSDDKGDAT